MKRVILDCDPGIDDTFALIYLAALNHAREVQIECVTTSAGNVGAEQCARNAAYVLSQCGLRTIPLAAGCDAPLALPLTTTPETHGETGLGYVTAPERHVERDFDALWIDAIERGTEDLHLIVTGPATNLAAFAQMHPRHFAELRHITVMGGAVNYPGNTTPNAEWNFWVDPHAANDVFAAAAEAGTAITLCPLNVTEQMWLAPERLDRIVALLGSQAIAEPLRDITRFYFEFHEDVGEGYGAQIHDLLTVLVALGRIPATTQPAFLQVETDSELMRGAVSADVKGIWDNAPNANVLIGCDVEKAWAEFERACKVHAQFAAGDAALAAGYHSEADD